MYHSRFSQKLHISDKHGIDEGIIIMRQPCRYIRLVVRVADKTKQSRKESTAM